MENDMATKKMTEARDDRMDKKAGIKENSARDMALDKKRGVAEKPTPPKRTGGKGSKGGKGQD